MSSIARSSWEGIRTGLGALPRDLGYGLRRLLLPASYWRSAEFMYVWQQLPERSAIRVLDLGSPKDLAVSLARTRNFELVATDILPSAVADSARAAAAIGRTGQGPGFILSEVQDGRALAYEDSAFDSAYSVSVLEHIPDTGDSLAIKELIRIVKPGGLVVITVPYAEIHHDTFVERGVYERGFQDAPVFFERHYDTTTLKSRLIEASGAELLDLQIWGERFIRGEKILAAAGKLRAALSPLEAPFASVCLRQAPQSSPFHAMAAFLTLRKPTLT